MGTPLNKYQRAAVDVYGEGNFGYVESYDYGDEHGDALLSFVLAELSDNEDCENLTTARRRIESGIQDLQDVLQALYEMEE